MIHGMRTMPRATAAPWPSQRVTATRLRLRLFVKPQSERTPPVCIGSATPALDAELVSALRELNNAALAARPYVESQTIELGVAPLDQVVGDASLMLERLDAAIADAGEALAKVPA